MTKATVQTHVAGRKARKHENERLLGIGFVSVASGGGDKRPHTRPIVRGDGTMNNLLFDLLALGHGHPHEGAVRDLIIQCIATLNIDVDVQIDTLGNLIVQVGDAPETMFSVHMDTVHAGKLQVIPVVTENTGVADMDYMVYGTVVKQVPLYQRSDNEAVITPEDFGRLAGEVAAKFYRVVDAPEAVAKPAGTKMMIKYKERYEALDKGVIHEGLFLEPCGHIKSDPEPAALGADDKVGCYIVLRMIEAGVKGLYIFHVGEECGSPGSEHIVKNTPDLVKGIVRAVAFDRAGYDDVIAHQRGQRCASVEFTNALAAALNEHLPPKQQFKGDVYGMFTDTANYTKLIAECTNLSVGYFQQHGDMEHFDLVWLEQCLLPAILQVDWSSLPTVRDPAAVEAPTWYTTGQHFPYRVWDGEDWSGYLDTLDKKDVRDGGNVDPNDGFAKKPQSNVLRRTLPHMVTKNTPQSQLPDWEPSTGICAFANKEQMVIIIRNWLITNGQSYTQLAEEMYNIVKENEALKVAKPD